MQQMRNDALMECTDDMKARVFDTSRLTQPGARVNTDLCLRNCPDESHLVGHSSCQAALKRTPYLETLASPNFEDMNCLGLGGLVSCAWPTSH